MHSLTVEELAVPANADAPDAADFFASVQIMGAIEVEGYRNDELVMGAAEVLPWCSRFRSNRVGGGWRKDLV